jgi:signal peptidase I
MGDARTPRRGRARWARAAVGVVAVTIAVRGLVLTPVGVEGPSMEPTVHDGAVVLVLRLGAGADRLRRGDLVVYRDPDGAPTLKRVVGLPGDRVAMLDAVLTVDEVPVEEPYVDHSRIDGTYLGRVVVPPGSVYVLGDNRALSIDSREYGSVPDADLVGRVVLHW